MGWLSGAVYRVKLTVDGTVPSLSGSVTMPAAAALPAGLKAYCGASGERLRFTSSDGETLIPYGIEDWSAAAPIVHFRDTFGTGDTYIYAYALSSGTDAQSKTGVAQDFALYLPLGDAGPTAYDWTANARNGTQSGGVTFGATGKIGPCCDFDGTNDTIYAATGIDYRSSNYTILFWAKSDEVAANDIGVVSIGGSDLDSTPAIVFQRDGTALLYAANGWWQGYKTVGTMAQDTWYRCGVTFNGSQHVTWFNGAVGSTTVSSAVTTSADQTCYCGSGYDGYFNGKLDGVCVAASALTADQIKFDAQTFPGSAMFSWGTLESAASAIALASETDSSLSITAVKRRALGLASETETPLSITAAKRRALGLASETETPLSITAAKRRALELASETDHARPMITEGGGLMLMVQQSSNLAL